MNLDNSLRLRHFLIRPRVILLAALCFLAVCAPHHGKPKDFVGKWRCTRACGVERLELRRDWTYVQSVRLEDGRTGTHTGRWSVEGTRLTLEYGALWCDVFGDKINDEPKIEDISYTTQWEYGRVILEFNPDLEGFTRER